MSLTYETLIEFLKNKMGLDTSDIEKDTKLFSSGILDSFSMVELVIFIEKSADIKLNPTDLRLDNLDSIERILNFIASLHEA